MTVRGTLLSVPGAVQAEEGEKKAGAPRKRTRPKSSARPARLGEQLAVELYARTKLALLKLGVSSAQQKRALRRAQKLTVTPSVSGPVLREIRGLSALLLEWSRAEEYLDDAGKPRILKVAGDEPSFEALARRCLPQTPLARAVELACATAEVARRPGGRIALLGGILVSVAESRDALLAHAIRMIDQLLETILHNLEVREQGKGQRRLERLVLGVVEREQIPMLMRELRPQIADLLHHVDTALQPRRPASRDALKRSTAVSVAVIVGQEDDWERAGLDAAPLVHAPRHRGVGPSDVGPRRLVANSRPKKK